MKKHFMNANNHPSIDETTNLFTSESIKLQDVISHALKNSEILSTSEIIEVYYQVSNVTSLAKFLRQKFGDLENTEENKTLLNKIQKMEKLIDEKFNETLHPLVMSQLKKSIENSRKNLKDMKTNQSKKTKNEIENQAMVYEKLRQTMSTKEFVDQYNKLLDKPIEN
jgi:glutamyl-tRNA reductase